MTSSRASAPAHLATSRGHRAFWLADLDYDWSALVGNLPSRVLAKDTVLFHQDSPAPAVFVIVHGRVRLVTHTTSGKERHIAVIGPAGLVGDGGMFDTGRHLTSAVASSEVTVHEVPLARLLDTMQADRQVLRQVLSFADRRLQIMLQHHDLMGSGSALKRVGSALLGLAHLYGEDRRGGRLITLLFTQEEMASICSLSRVSVSTVFGELEARGLLGREGRRIVVRDIAALEHAVDRDTDSAH